MGVEINEGGVMDSCEYCGSTEWCECCPSCEEKNSRIKKLEHIVMEIEKLWVKSPDWNKTDEGASWLVQLFLATKE